jgi:hypothetical protein
MTVACFEQLKTVKKMHAYKNIVEAPLWLLIGIPPLLFFGFYILLINKASRLFLGRMGVYIENIVSSDVKRRRDSLTAVFRGICHVGLGDESSVMISVAPHIELFLCFHPYDDESVR